MTEASAAGRAASDAISKLDDALKQLAAVPVAKAPAPAFAAPAAPAAAPATPAAPAPPAVGAGGGDARAKVVAIYETCNPTKLGEVDNLLAKYAGREDELVRGSGRSTRRSSAGSARRPRPQHPPRRPRRRRPPPTPKPEPAPPRPRLSKPHRSITSNTALKPLARSLKKKVGAAVNSVGNDCASALKCAETLSDLVEDPLGRKTKAPSNPFGAFGGGSASQPLHVAHGGALQQCGVDDGTVSRFAAHLACDKLLEKLTGETFDRRKDVWALAACVCEFVAKDTSSFQTGTVPGQAPGRVAVGIITAM